MQAQVDAQKRIFIPAPIMVTLSSHSVSSVSRNVHFDTVDVPYSNSTTTNDTVNSSSLMHIDTQSCSVHYINFDERSEFETTPSPPSIASMLPILDSAQLEVLLSLDLSTQSVSSQDNNFVHKVQTRLQTAVIPRKHYASYLASLPELTSLKIDEETYTGGFLFIANISDVVESTTFRSAATKCEWKKTM